MKLCYSDYNLHVLTERKNISDNISDTPINKLFQRLLKGSTVYRNSFYKRLTRQVYVCNYVF